MAERKKKRSALRFAGGMLLYALVFTLLIVVGMRLFWGYIAEYEASRDKHAIEAYMQSMDEEHIRAVARPFIDTLDTAIQNPEQSVDAVADVMNGELSYERLGGESSAKRVVYRIFNSERTLGRVVMTRPDNPPFGFSMWSVEEESYDFSFLLGSSEITVPENWTVSVNGTALSADHLTRSGIRYRYLKDFYGKNLPELFQCTYRVENYIGTAPFEVKDSFGVPVDVSGLNEDRFLDNCTEDEKAADEAFIRAFLPYYVECLANTRRDAEDNYNRIKPYLVSGSDLATRLKDAIAGQYYAHSQGETIVSVNMDRHVHLGGDCYLVEFTYELDSVSQWEAKPTRSENHAQIILRRTDNGLKAQAIYSL